MGAGTSANVYIVLYGCDGTTEEVILADTSKKKKDSFKRGSVDQFVKEVRTLVYKCCFPLTEARMIWKKFSSHKSASLGVSVGIGHMTCMVWRNVATGWVCKVTLAMWFLSVICADTKALST